MQPEAQRRKNNEQRNQQHKDMTRTGPHFIHAALDFKEFHRQPAALGRRTAKLTRQSLKTAPKPALKRQNFLKILPESGKFFPPGDQFWIGPSPKNLPAKGLMFWHRIGTIPDISPNPISLGTANLLSHIRSPLLLDTSSILRISANPS